MGEARRANWSQYGESIHVKVMCPECGAGGANGLGYQPKCHKCIPEKDVYMHPANNTKIVCTWDEFIEYMKEKGLYNE